MSSSTMYVMFTTRKHFFVDCISLLQKEPDGVMTVKFRDPISARACIIVSEKSQPIQSMGPSDHFLAFKKMEGRFFDGRRIEATLYSGKERFQRSGAADDILGVSDETEKKRLDDFAHWLLTEGD